MGLKIFGAKKLFSCWAWLWDFSGFQGFELFARVYACARVCVHMRARAKSFFGGGGGFFSFSRARTCARTHTRAKTFFLLSGALF